MTLGAPSRAEAHAQPAPRRPRGGWALQIGLAAVVLAPPAARADAPRQAEGPSRVDFDDRLIRGQRKAGGVYIFQRDKVELASMVTRPHSFRQRIVETVFHPPPRRR